MPQELTEIQKLRMQLTAVRSRWAIEQSSGCFDKTSWNSDVEDLVRNSLSPMAQTRGLFSALQVPLKYSLLPSLHQRGGGSYARQTNGSQYMEGAQAKTW